MKNPHPAVASVVEAYHKGNADFHQMVADLAEITRKEAKTVNLGIMYGMGKGKLANVLGINTEEATELMNNYHANVPFVKGMADAAMERAAKNGQIRTWLGRKCRFDMWEPKSFGYHKALKLEEAAKIYGGKGMIRRAFTYKALNKLIQGSSADQTKKAMVDLYEQDGIIPHIQVHDELNISVKNKSEALSIKKKMAYLKKNLFN